MRHSECFLMDAYSPVTSLASRDTMQRLTRTPLDLAGSIAQPAGLEISVHFTQEELSQMVVARRERVSLGNQAEPQRAEARANAATKMDGKGTSISKCPE